MLLYFFTEGVLSNLQKSTDLNALKFTGFF